MANHCLLVNPLTPSCSQLPFFTELTSSPPLGIGYVAGYLLDKGIDVSLIDEMATPLNREKLESAISALAKPRILGLSCMTLNASRMYELAREAKAIDPEILVFTGGIHPTVQTEEVIGKDCIDGVIKGEGEETFHEVVRAILSQQTFAGIRGLIYKEKGTVIANEPRPLIKELDNIPPFPYHLFDETYHLYSTFANIISSRGCPFDCIFCSQRSMTQRKFRTHSLERVISEIDLLIGKYGQRIITFSDDMALSNKNSFSRMLDRFIEKGYQEKVEFIMQARSDYIDHEVIQKMKAANFTMLSFGVETGTERLTKLIQKEERLEDHINAIKLASDAGIATNGVFIYGFPTETVLDRRETIAFAHKLHLDSIRFNIAVPYPGTKLFEMAKEEGRLNIKKDWENFAVQYYLISDDIPYVPEGNNRHQLIYDTMKANLMFYLHPKMVFRLLFSKKMKYGGVVNIKDKRSLKRRMEMMWMLVQFGLHVSKRFLSVFLKATFKSAHE